MTKRGRGRPKGSTSTTKSPKTLGRGRGRPRKDGTETTGAHKSSTSKLSTAKSNESAISNVSAPTSAPPGRRRGRPKKELTIAATSNPTGRARGRPKKDAVPQASTPAFGTPSRGRGRPRKDDTTAASSNPIKRARGRPKKVETLVTPAKRGGPKKDTGAGQATLGTPKSSRGRGRPKKASAPPTTPAHLVITSDVEEDAEDVAVSNDLTEAPIDPRGQETHQPEL